MSEALHIRLLPKGVIGAILLKHGLGDFDKIALITDEICGKLLKGGIDLTIWPSSPSPAQQQPHP